MTWSRSNITLLRRFYLSCTDQFLKLWFTDLWACSLAEADYIHQGRWGWPMRGCVWFAGLAHGTDLADTARTFPLCRPSVLYTSCHTLAHKWHTLGLCRVLTGRLNRVNLARRNWRKLLKRLGSAPIAQLVEQLICNQWVGSSSLSGGTIFYNKINKLMKI